MAFIILLVLAIVVVSSCAFVVKEKHCYVIERLGSYHTVCNSGLHFKLPVIDRVVSKLSLKEQVLDFEPQSVITKDNVTIRINSVVYANVFDPKSYTYGVENPILGLQNLTATTLRNIIGTLELDQTLTSRETINEQMQESLDRATDAWGIKVNRVEIKDIIPPKDIQEAMEKQMRAERERRQAVLEAQAHKESAITRAEGDKEAKIIEAEGIKQSQIILANADAEKISIVNRAEVEAAKNLKNENVAEIVTKLRGLNTLRDVADGQATKLFIPSDMTDSLGKMAILGETVNPGPAVSVKPRDSYRQMVSKEAARSAVSDDACIKQGTSPVTRNAAMANYSNNHKLERR